MPRHPEHSEYGLVDLVLPGVGGNDAAADAGPKSDAAAVLFASPDLITALTLALRPLPPALRLLIRD